MRMALICSLALSRERKEKLANSYLQSYFQHATAYDQRIIDNEVLVRAAMWIYGTDYKASFASVKHSLYCEYVQMILNQELDTSVFPVEAVTTIVHMLGDQCDSALATSILKSLLRLKVFAASDRILDVNTELTVSAVYHVEPLSLF